MMLLKLTEITADTRAQPRAEMSISRIDEYAEEMQRGDKFPPLIVIREKDKFWLADGFHRYHAALSAGLPSFECHVRDGTLRDAILFSCGANAAHGLRRTNLDKRRAAGKLLEDEEWGKWSDSEIARHCSVTQPFVGKVRKEVEAFSPKTVIGERRYVTKHGTETTMSPPKPEEKPPDGELVAKWLGEIERMLDRMPEPAAALACFPQERHYLFPLSKLEFMAGWLGEFAHLWQKKIIHGGV